MPKPDLGPLGRAAMKISGESMVSNPPEWCSPIHASAKPSRSSSCTSSRVALEASAGSPRPRGTGATKTPWRRSITGLVASAGLLAGFVDVHGADLRIVGRDWLPGGADRGPAPWLAARTPGAGANGAEAAATAASSGTAHLGAPGDAQLGGPVVEVGLGEAGRGSGAGPWAGDHSPGPRSGPRRPGRRKPERRRPVPRAPRPPPGGPGPRRRWEGVEQVDHLAGRLSGVDLGTGSVLALALGPRPAPRPAGGRCPGSAGGPSRRPSTR